MSDVMAAGEVRPLRASEDIFMAGVNLGADALHGTLSGVFEIAKAIRSETLRLTSGGLEGIESVSSAFTQLVRGSGQAAGEVIARTAASIVGKKDLAQKAA